MLTNWKTVAKSIKRLEEVEKKLEEEDSGLTKKELLNQQREYDKLQKTLGGVRTMGGVPDMLFVIDTNHESIAVKEAARLNIPVIAIVDSDSDPDGITYPIPGNDDSTSATNFYCNMIADAALEGIEKSATYAAEEAEKETEQEAEQEAEQATEK
jgi:small subunit ribosomal protein S2